MSDKKECIPGSENEKGRQGDFKETRTSNYHPHKDGTKGYDQEIVINSYRDDEVKRTRQHDADKKYKGHTVGKTKPQ